MFFVLLKNTFASVVTDLSFCIESLVQYSCDLWYVLWYFFKDVYSFFDYLRKEVGKQCFLGACFFSPLGFFYDL